MHKYSFRTDFADELYGKSEKDKGILIKHSKNDNMAMTWVTIKKEHNDYGKPVGNYITIECDDLDNQKEVAKKISSNLKKIIKINGNKVSDKILVVGLGNGRFLSDALGPKVTERLNITSHILLKKKIRGIRDVSCISPGVMATTGMETSDIIKSLVKSFGFQLIIVVDALATRSVKRLNKAFQISDVGISPGSGINNQRKPITKETMGVPVIAVGVATVVDSASLVVNVLNSIDGKFSMKTTHETISKVLIDKEENLVMTSKEIDRIIVDLAEIISSSINYTLNSKLCH